MAFVHVSTGRMRAKLGSLPALADGAVPRRCCAKASDENDASSFCMAMLALLKRSLSRNGGGRVGTFGARSPREKRSSSAVICGVRRLCSLAGIGHGVLRSLASRLTISWKFGGACASERTATRRGAGARGSSRSRIAQ